MTTTTPKPAKLHWMKFNPTEWLGMFSELTDEELGLLHRVIAKLWAVPGNRLTEAALLAELRIQSCSPRADVLRGLIGYALKDSGDGMLGIPALNEAFTDVARRADAGKAGAAGRWPKAEPVPLAVPVTVDPNPKDF